MLHAKLDKKIKSLFFFMIPKTTNIRKVIRNLINRRIVSSIDFFNTCELHVLDNALLIFANRACSSSSAVIWGKKVTKDHKQDNIVENIYI
jgi:hypothetical protein